MTVKILTSHNKFSENIKLHDLECKTSEQERLWASRFAGDEK